MRQLVERFESENTNKYKYLNVEVHSTLFYVPTGVSSYFTS